MKAESFFTPHTGKDLLIDLDHQIGAKTGNLFTSFLKNPIERLFSINKLNLAYSRASSMAGKHTIFKSWLESLQTTYKLCGLTLSKVPATGPLVITANHPFGGLEGIILGDILTRTRPDVKILGNHLLSLVPELKPYLIPINVFAGKKGAQQNAKAIRSAIKFVKEGGCLITFPAGTVSHFKFSARKSVDPAWSPHLGAIIRRSAATVVPVFFPGSNSLFFQAAGLFNARLRTALLPHELMNKSTREIELQFGHPIPWGKLQGLKDNQTLINHLRVKTYLLENRLHQNIENKKTTSKTKAAPDKTLEAFTLSSIHDYTWEIKALPPESLLAENRQFEVYLARASEIPGLMLEIGRLREQTFRQEGEGTGGKTDLDRFDLTYHHLILWDKELQRPAGAYRFCLTDEIIAEDGIDGLYTNTLFKFKKGFLEQTGPAMELGRSFIRPEYQGSPLCLALLWKAIGSFIGKNPQYSSLFGPVTISAAYHDVSKNILIDYLMNTRRNNHLGHFAKPRNPFRLKRRYGVNKKLLYSCLCSIDDVANIISQIERDQKGVPILLRHYLKLNASFVDFNIDEQFSNAIDGLMVVDLRKTPEKFLVRFMGKEGHENFAQFHMPQQGYETFNRAI